MDCLDPLPQLRNASAVQDILKTTTNATVAIQCHEGYAPINPMNITCNYSNFMYGWEPDPGSLCIKLEGILG